MYINVWFSDYHILLHIEHNSANPIKFNAFMIFDRKAHIYENVFIVAKSYFIFARSIKQMHIQKITVLLKREVITTTQGSTLHQTKLVFLFVSIYSQTLRFQSTRLLAERLSKQPSNLIIKRNLCWCCRRPKQPGSSPSGDIFYFHLFFTCFFS